MTATMNGTASRCTCTNPHDRCPACRAWKEAAKATPPAARKPRQTVEPPSGDGERWLTPAQAAAMLAVGLRTLLRLTAEGVIPAPYRFTRKLVRYDYQTLVQFMRKMREDAAQQPPAA